MLTPPITSSVLRSLLFFAVSSTAASAQSAEQRNAASTGHRAPLTTIKEAFARWPDLKNNEEPVEFEGVVTGTMPSGSFRMHDGELGIYVTRSPAGQTLTAGDRVAVSGVLRMGGFSPWISPHTLKKLGRGVYPEARQVSHSVLASGAADNQWVEVKGVVRAVHVPEPRNFAVLELGMPGGEVRVLVSYERDVAYESLVDAAVRIRGVAAVNVNAQKHVVEPSFRVPSFSEITVLRSGQADPFAQALVPVARLMRFSPGSSHRHRVRTSGVVTRQISDATLFVRDDGAGLKVKTNSTRQFRPGEIIEAAGFPIIADGMAVLEHAVVRSVGASTAPVPAQPTLATLLEGRHNSDLVSIPARLVDWAVAGKNVTLIFQTGDQLFKGLLTISSSTPLSLPSKDSVVNVTGICVIDELAEVWFYQPRSFLVLLADPEDVRLVQAPPWWTPERLWWALAITGLVLLAAAAWVWALRRQIDRKRAIIEQQARHAAALEERSRIARELHDTLEQGLTGLSLQMKAMETDLGTSPHPASTRLQFARQMLRQSRALARNAIREMRADTLPSRLEGMIEGLKRVADSWNQSGALIVSVDVVGAVRPLAAPLENHLLGIGTEAMTNAVKHGRAEAIHVEIAFRSAEITLRIEDNGSGFDPDLQLQQASGCFGLLGMRERARELRGELQIKSQPGKGTEVLVTVPNVSESRPAAPQEKSASSTAPLPLRSPAV